MQASVVVSESKLPEKRFIGKYVCYGEPDGSFSWGRIVNEGVVNTPKGDKEVFILSDRMTCYVPKSDMAMASAHAISRKIGSGNANKGLPPKPEPRQLPEKKETLPAIKEARAPELDGIVPKLEDVMGLDRESMQSAPPPMAEMVKTIPSSVDGGREITFVFRRYGYPTNVRKERLNLETDIVDRKFSGIADLTDDQLFLLAMGSKMSGLKMNQGMQNMLTTGAAISNGDTTVAEKLSEAVRDHAAETLKKRIAENDVIEAEVVSESSEKQGG